MLLSDGNQNLGNAVEQAQAVSAAGVGIDAVPIRYRTRAEMIVDRVALPPRRPPRRALRPPRGDHEQQRGHAGDHGDVPGRLLRVVDDRRRDDTLSDQPVVLPPGKKVFAIRQKIEAANFYTYEASFIPDRPEDDAIPQNNGPRPSPTSRAKARCC